MKDVVIVGGGPAGSTAGILLSRRGWNVVLLEQHRFPRDKVCGECLSALGMDVARRIGVDQLILNAGAIQLRHAAVYCASGRGVKIPLRRSMWGVSRNRLDLLMVNAARQAGADVREMHRCEEIGMEGRLSLRVRRLVDNAIEMFCPAVVLLADGKSGLMGNRPAATGDLGIKSHFADVNGPRDTVELFGMRGCYGGLSPIESGGWNLACSVPASRVQSHRGNFDSVLAEMMAENSVLAGRLASARRVGNWLAAPLPRFAVRHDWMDGVIPIGNAAGAIEPIGGEGMGVAMRSAELAVEAVEKSVSEGRKFLRGEYEKIWRRRRWSCRGVAMGLVRPGVAEMGVKIVAGNRFVMEGMMGLIGK